jgi:hypothetical protein
MKRLLTVTGLLMIGIITAFGQTSIFTEDFESGTISGDWSSFYSEAATISAVAMTSAPATLTGGGDYVGLIHDTSPTAAYTGAAELIGSPNAANYTIEGDVYCYTYHDSGSAYTGLVINSA